KLLLLANTVIAPFQRLRGPEFNPVCLLNGQTIEEHYRVYWIRANFRHYCMEQFTLRKLRPFFFCKRNSVVSYAFRIL
ncbi:MAG TPA: hypothetical protein VFP47_16630, partial [Pyrinomonadaceae bacterium]|nr:hypothetical protein [Pyrinomonadaceae bacterium]